MRLPRPPALIAAATLLAIASCGIGGAARQRPVILTVAAGGEPADGAGWITTWVVPAFQRAHPGVKVVLLPGGDAEQYRTKIARDLESRRGADVITLDGLWIGELARSGRLRPLTDVAGPAADSWEGWSHIPQAVQGLGQFDGRRYGLPLGADARVLYYNRNLFRRAGLPQDWQPGSWQDILDAGAALKKLPGVTPVQIDAGTAMGEATTVNGVLPLLAGTGSEIYARGKWTGASTAMKEVLAFYRQIYTTGLGDPRLQQEPDGRDRSFAAFADGRIGILAESDSFWRSVIAPGTGTAPMPDRDTAVGHAKIPARRPGAGIRGQDHVSMSGGSVRVLNPFTKHPGLAWQLLAFMHSKDATMAELAGQARITARKDVNDQVLAQEPVLKHIADEVLPLTAYRPPLAVYPQVSAALQEATAAAVSGRSPERAAAAYRNTLERLVGGAADIAG